MFAIELTEEEAVALSTTVVGVLSDLGEEIVATDNPEYRRGLRERRQQLNQVLDKINGGLQVTSVGAPSPAAEVAEGG